MIQEYQFGPWLPEATDYKNPGLEVCKNTIPAPSGYRPFLGAVGSGASVTGTVLGALGCEKSDGTPVVCVATASDLYVITGGTANASSLSLSLAATDYVRFEQYNAKVYATTKSGVLWVLDDVDTDTTFAVVSGSPPKANAIGRVSDFLVLGDVDDGSDVPTRVRWSPFNDPEGTYTSDIATQTDFQDLDDKYGPVTAIAGGDFGLVFQKKAVSRMTYRGDASVFAFERFEYNRGCSAPASVVRVGDTAFYLSLDGFFMTDGSSVRPISQGRVWEWFVDTANQTYVGEVVGAIDLENRLAVWSFASADTRARDTLLCFNWETERWSYVEQAADWIYGTGRAGLTLEQVSAIYTNLDTMPLSLDSVEFRASGNSLGGVVDGEAVTFTGVSKEALMTSGSLQPFSGRRTYIRGVTPLLANEDESTEVALGYRDRMTQSFTETAFAATGSLGYSPQATDARYFRVTHKIPEGARWSDAYGFQLDVSPSGYA